MDIENPHVYIFKCVKCHVYHNMQSCVRGSFCQVVQTITPTPETKRFANNEN